MRVKEGLGEESCDSPIRLCKFQVAPLHTTRYHWLNQESGSGHKEKAQNMDYRGVTEVLVNCEHNIWKLKMEEATA